MINLKICIYDWSKRQLWQHLLFQSIELSKKETISAKLSKIEEASKKKDEQTSVFINQTKEALDQKMELHTEKRDAYISDIKTKLKEHVSLFGGSFKMSLFRLFAF